MPPQVTSSGHPLEQLLAQRPKQGWQEPNLRPGPKAPILQVEGEGEEGSALNGSGSGGAGSGHRFPLRLSPAGARSLLFANFWTALLATPLRWGRGDIVCGRGCCWKGVLRDVLAA